MQAETLRLTQYSKGGGCGCKISPSILQQLLQGPAQAGFERLLVGSETSDDAAIFKIDGEKAVISTADFFLPIVDDAFDFGRVAAANSISDVYAMGGSPLMAVAILGWPIEKLPIEEARRMMEGARAVCSEAGIPLAGGHTIDSSDPLFGLAVTGEVALKHIKPNSTGKLGDLLFLTKPIGVGLLSTALKKGLLQPEHYAPLLEQMTSLNRIGEMLGRVEEVHAMTDVTGFGLLGHLVEMTEGSGLSAELFYGKIQKIAGVDDYLRQKTIPDATFRNWNSYGSKLGFDKGVNVTEAFNLLPDPQTNGGLLFAVEEAAADAVVALMEKQGYRDFIEPVGRLVPRVEKNILVKA